MDRQREKTARRAREAAQSPNKGAPPCKAEQRNEFDRWLHARIGDFTTGISPAGVAEAWFDWAVHLGMAPGRRTELGVHFVRNCAVLADRTRQIWMGQTPEPLPGKHARRFAGEGWQAWPFAFYRDWFQLYLDWWDAATQNVPGATEKHLRLTRFVGHQALEALSPTNALPTNPEALALTMEEGGANLQRGLAHAIEDVIRHGLDAPDPQLEDFKVGEKIATTPGKVVYRNELIELIQYTPRTDRVRPEPVLICPAWIMKYYILDLSPQNSLIGYLVDQGFTVFAISWRNPGPRQRDLGMDDYRTLGPLAAFDAIGRITGDRPVHAVGYCLGGTLMSLTAAAMAREGDDRIKTLTLFAALTDFDEPGELGLFMDESQVAFLEDLMWDKGTLSADQMLGAFLLLRVHDLLWGKITREYLMGERVPMIDLMAWNADATRMPFRMHSEYLRAMYLGNQLAEGQYLVDGTPVALPDIRAPMFVVGTENDHIAPWRSVYKVHLLADSEITFCLVSSGHNAGIVSEPGRKRRHRRVRTAQPEDFYIDPDRWMQETPVNEGSWWLDWVGWLEKRSGRPVKPPPMGRPEAGLVPLGPAPGSYVMQR